MSFEDFFQAEILLWSGVEPVYILLNLIHFHMNALTLTNFPLGDRRDINYHLIGVLSLLGQLETCVSLAAAYSKYPRIVRGGTSNWPVYTPFSQLRCQKNTALPRLSRQLRNIQDYVHPEDHTQPTYEMTPGFKPFTQEKALSIVLFNKWAHCLKFIRGVFNTILIFLHPCIH